MASARHALASMLDELMGKHRNALPSERPADAGFEDPDVCKYFLAGYCHHELFTNTKADLGPCGKVHDEKLRHQYRSSNKFEKLGYEDEWLDALQRVHNDMQKKIMRNKQRLDLTQTGGKVEDPNKETQTNVDSLSEKITAMLEQAETLGSQGRVEEAQKLIEKTEEVKKERDNCRKKMDPAVGDLKPMEVCDTCACFLIVGDSQHRIDEHLMGKQHLGFAKIKATIEELIRKKEEKKRQREGQYAGSIRETEKRNHERDRGQYRHQRYHHSRSKSPESSHGGDRYFPRRSAEYRRQREGHYHRGSVERRFSEEHHGHRHSSTWSRYSSHDRYRTRSPERRRSRSPYEINGQGRRTDRTSSTSSFTSAADGHKVNIPSPYSLTAPSTEQPGASYEDDDEDEEGLIKSSDE